MQYINNTRNFKGKVGFLASPGHQIDTLITGYSQIVNNIQNIDIDKRKCAADNEINLKYFKGSRD